MKKFKQVENYPIGDCVRTCMACILDVDKIEDVPNFMRDEEPHFIEYLTEWLENNNLEYMQMEIDDFFNSPWMPKGYCLLAGKSPRGEWDHMVVGEIKAVIKEGQVYREIHFAHDTSPHHDGTYIDGDIKYVGFLQRKL